MIYRQPRPGLSGGHYLQGWLLLISLGGFGFYVLIDLNLLSLLWQLDRSHMASLALGLLGLATAHCGWHLTAIARQINEATVCLTQSTQEPPSRSMTCLTTAGAPVWIAELSSLPAATEHARIQLLDVAADDIRSPVELGWYLVDMAIRLGLLGTIIGFILIFGSLDTIRIDQSEDLKSLLIAMSGGMGTALLTTLTGLVVASLLGLQYLILGRASEALISLLTRISVQATPSTSPPGDLQVRQAIANKSDAQARQARFGETQGPETRHWPERVEQTRSSSSTVRPKPSR